MKNAALIAIHRINWFKKDDRARYLIALFEEYPKGEAERMQSILRGLWERMARTDHYEALCEGHVYSVIEGLLCLRYAEVLVLLETIAACVDGTQVEDKYYERIREFFQGILGGVLATMVNNESECSEEPNIALERAVATLVVETIHRLSLLQISNRGYSFEADLMGYLCFRHSTYGKEKKAKDLLRLRHGMLVEELAKRQFPEMNGSVKELFSEITKAVFSHLDPNAQVGMIAESFKAKVPKQERAKKK